jgi:hypothetical protein
MKPHTWVIEEADGFYDYYHCTSCGCGGGGTMDYMLSKKGSKGVPLSLTPKPFFPGPAIDLSDDCDEAHTQIVFYLRGFMRAAETYNRNSQAIQTVRCADRYTPSERPRVVLYNLLIDGQPLEKIKEGLVVGGFKLEPPTCPRCGEENDRWADDHTPYCYGCAIVTRMVDVGEPTSRFDSKPS